MDRTDRMRIATQCLQGLLANPDMTGALDDRVGANVLLALVYADELIRQEERSAGYKPMPVIPIGSSPDGAVTARIGDSIGDHQAEGPHVGWKPKPGAK